MPPKSIVLLKMGKARPLSRLSSIPLYVCATSSLCTHLLMDNSVASMSRLLWILPPWTLGCVCLSESVSLFVSHMCPRVELWARVAALCSVSRGAFILLSTVAAPSHAPAISVGGLPFIHIFSNICDLCSFWWWPFWQVWGGISVWFWFAFPWWLMTLSIFSVPVGHLYVFFEKIKFFCRFFKWTF